MEFELYQFMDFSREDNRKARAFYSKFFDDAHKILEIACGRGEFLEVMQAAGKDITGVDSEPEMIAEVRKLGLKAIQADAFEFLANTKEKYDGIFSAHFIEHLDSGAALKLLELCKSRLVTGGVLVVAAPNPGCVTTTTHEFWRDPTHVRMYDLPLVEFMMHEAGLEVIEGGLNPENWSGPPFDEKTLTAIPLPAAEIPELAEAAPDAEEAGSWKDRLVKRLIWMIAPGSMEELSLLKAQASTTIQAQANAIAALQAVVANLYPPNELFVAARKVRA